VSTSRDHEQGEISERSDWIAGEVAAQIVQSAPADADLLIDLEPLREQRIDPEWFQSRA
jgi:hypothetical protein